MDANRWTADWIRENLTVTVRGEPKLGRNMFSISLQIKGDAQPYHTATSELQTEAGQ